VEYVKSNRAHSVQKSPFGEAGSRLASQASPAFYGSMKFIVFFTEARYWYLSWAWWIRTTAYFNIILPLSVLVSSLCFHPKFGHAFLIVPMPAVTLLILAVGCKLWNCSCNFIQLPGTCLFLKPLISALYSQTPTVDYQQENEVSK
jgi:hypothetical protein